jgi:hypothetical protein
MKQKNTAPHTPVQSNLRWGCDEAADRMVVVTGRWGGCGDRRFNHTAEAQASSGPSFTIIPVALQRLWIDFIAESKKHGWPSFRDNEVNWDVVRVLKNGETVSVDGTHLGKQ